MKSKRLKPSILLNMERVEGNGELGTVPEATAASSAHNALDSPPDGSLPTRSSGENAVVLSENAPPTEAATQSSTNSTAKKPVKLYKSSRLKGYITLALASFINYDSAQKSGNVDTNSLHVVPSTDDQRRYAVAVAIVSMFVSGFCLVAHLDRITPLEKIWIMLFQQQSQSPLPLPPPSPDQAGTEAATEEPPASSSGEAAAQPPAPPLPTTSSTGDDNNDNNTSSAMTTATTATSTTSTTTTSTTFEGALAVFLCIWWSIATGVATSVRGMAGDGKGQYSLYYSYWACCLTSYWILERWGVAAGWSSLRSFISSWPNRSPAWICIMALSFLTLIWYLDLWQNHGWLDRPQEEFILKHFNAIGDGQWQWLMIVVVFTFSPSVVFVLIELFRETKADGSTAAKSPTEVFLEGICFLILILAWTPTVMIATTPRGAASLIGNSYFTTWLMSIFVFEGFIWFIHDKRNETYYAIKVKEEEYRRRQRMVLEQTLAIQRKHEERGMPIGTGDAEGPSARSGRRTTTE